MTYTILILVLFNLTLKNQKCISEIELTTFSSINNDTVFEKIIDGVVHYSDFPTIEIHLTEKDAIVKYEVNKILDNMNYFDNRLTMTKFIFYSLETPQKFKNLKLLDRERLSKKIGLIENHRVEFDFEERHYILEYENFGALLIYSFAKSYPLDYSIRDTQSELFMLNMKRKIKSKCLK